MDQHTLPAGSLDAAIAAMQAALGAEHVLVDEAQMADHGDPFAPPGEWYRPGAVLLPGSVEDVQAVLRIATEHGTPVWTSSQGRNKGYGGGAPRVSGSFTMSLRRMNRVLQVDEENCMALVEPGVRFFDLYEHLKATGSKLWMSVP
ncbi:MAG TPA: FAD-dependent oxidoreductase, partial [Paracoccaceae bacterium]|nr:FAD-dependent oxidoreductase [Paracoccaceae bacterium]